jgi:hypothetical protein
MEIPGFRILILKPIINCTHTHQPGPAKTKTAGACVRGGALCSIAVDFAGITQ